VKEDLLIRHRHVTRIRLLRSFCQIVCVWIFLLAQAFIGFEYRIPLSSFLRPRQRHGSVIVRHRHYRRRLDETAGH